MPVERFVAFLRGMNLGNRRIKNPELVAHFEAMEQEDVATFRASGNVVFSDPAGEAESKLEARVEEELDERLGYEIGIILKPNWREHDLVVIAPPHTNVAIEAVD